MAEGSGASWRWVDISHSIWMNAKEETALRELYRSWPNERLVLAVTHHRHEYRPEAIAIALKELEQRDISPEVASEVAVGFPNETRELTQPHKVFGGVGRYVQRQFIGLATFVAGFIGLILAELATRRLSGSDTYYQAHAAPRLIGAILAFAFSLAALKALAWLVRWSKVGDRSSSDRAILPKTDRELVGWACYLPYILFAICTAVAFL